MKEAVIIVAGGIGSRMKNSMPKQFMELNGIPIIIHTLNQFYAYNPNINVCIVVHEDYMIHWSVLHSEYFPQKEILSCSGGKTRFHSVQNGLALLPDEGIIGVHDAARPLVSRKVISNCFKAAAIMKAVIPVIPIHESLRKVFKDSSVHVDRSEFKIVQTPQCFSADLLKEAYNQEYSSVFTDDASVVENCGNKIHLEEGNRENLKITEPSDLRIAEWILNR